MVVVLYKKKYCTVGMENEICYCGLTTFNQNCVYCFFARVSLFKLVEIYIFLKEIKMHSFENIITFCFLYLDNSGHKRPALIIINFFIKTLQQLRLGQLQCRSPDGLDTETLL